MQAMVALSPSNTTLKIIICVAGVFSLLSLLSVIFFLTQFKKASNSIMIKKRHPEILHVQAILTLIWFSFCYVLALLDFCKLKELAGWKQQLIEHIDRLLFPGIPYGIILCMTWRFWHIFYDLKYASSQKNSEWKHHLDPLLVRQNFWIGNKATLGTVAWTRKRWIVIYVITSILMIVPYQIAIFIDLDIIGHLAGTFIASVAVVVNFIIWRNVPKFADNFFVKEELHTTALGMVASIPFSTITSVSSLFAPPELFVIIAISYAAILLFLSSFYSFYWIPKKIRHKQQEQQLRSIAQRHEESVHSSSRTTDNREEIGGIVHRLSHLARMRKTYNLHAVLSNPGTFKLFMQHLLKEFSTECLLCFAEAVQYKFLMRERIDIVDPSLITQEHNFTATCPLSTIIPISAVNRNGFSRSLASYHRNGIVNDVTQEAKDVCFALYNKYVKVGCELEVNISYAMRARLNGLMTSRSFWDGFNITTNELFCLYDAIAEQMYRLMDGSFVRFKQEEIFQTVKQMIDDAAPVQQSPPVRKPVDVMVSIPDTT